MIRTITPALAEVVRLTIRDEVIAVAGGGRCGSSAMMKILGAIGIPFTGTAETSELREDRQLEKLFLPGDKRDATWVFESHGHAIKFLNPHFLVPPKGPKYRWIWMDRNEKDQLASQYKLAEWMGRARRPYELKEWRRKSLSKIKQLGGPLLVTRFETMINKPRPFCVRIATYLGLPLDVVDYMVPIIHKRKTKVLNHMVEGHFVKETLPWQPHVDL